RALDEDIVDWLALGALARAGHVVVGQVAFAGRRGCDFQREVALRLADSVSSAAADRPPALHAVEGLSAGQEVGIVGLRVGNVGDYPWRGRAPQHISVKARVVADAAGTLAAMAKVDSDCVINMARQHPRRRAHLTVADRKVNQVHFHAAALTGSPTRR